MNCIIIQIKIYRKSARKMNKQIYASFGSVSADNNELHPVKLRSISSSNFVELVLFDVARRESEIENMRPWYSMERGVNKGIDQS